MSFFRKTIGPPVMNGLIAWWRFDEGVGTKSPDSTPNRYDLTAFDTYPSYVGGNLRGYAFSFNGTHSSLKTTTSLHLQTLSYSAWVYYSTTPGTNYTIIAGDSLGSSGSNGGGAQLRIESSLKLGFLKSCFAELGTSSGTVPKNIWAYVAVTYNSLTGSYVFYINGSPSGSGTSIQTFNVQNTTIGENGCNTSEYFSGKIDEVRIYNRVLTAQEILILYKWGL